MPQRIVLTGLGLTSPIGNDLATLRQSLLDAKPGVTRMTPRYMAEWPAGICDFPVLKHQNRKDARRGTRAGQIAIYCGREAIADSGIDLDRMDRSRVGVFVGVTEHGNVETENEVANIKEYGYDVKYWSHHHNPRSIANNPAGELCLNAGLTGPHCCIGAACAAGNYGLIHGAQQLMLGEVDLAIAGGVSESIHTFGIFASFLAQNALAPMGDDPARASRPFAASRKGIVIAEGGCLYTLERLEDAQKRGAAILAELLGWAVNTDATDFVLPNPERQAQAMSLALRRAGLAPGDIDIISAHATSTPEGDSKEVEAIRSVFGDDCPAYVNAAKGYYGHAMGAAGALELAGNLPSFGDGMVHPSINIDELDPACALPNLVANKAVRAARPVRTILNNSFGMLGINAVTIVGKFEG
ncbi:MAG: beta-ketoacyl-[acyl-carrier-protein] synthase family protein [Planctomycetota bacterium]|jgi:3-oxoacyl-[acyl-carrier-protein] synthase II|nr:beta-ketoacyl-[acyl-carrier-protein] synthase family protein [Planctomycetota bacterium]